jgi:transposase InsO family protein
MAVDKFSKWIEATPITNQEATTAVKFFESIVFRYGVPHSIITDNGSNFTSGEFQEFTKDMGIQISYASVAHPQTNGQVEKANGLVCRGLKKRLLRPLKHAADAWGQRTTLCAMESTNNTKRFHRSHTILPPVWSRSSTPIGCPVQRPMSGSLR